MKSHKRILKSLRGWYTPRTDGRRTYGDMRCQSSYNQDRTEEQAVWDAAILTAAELVRRLNGDEAAVGAIHGLLSTRLPKDE